MSVIAIVAFIAVVGWKLDLSFSGIPTLITAIGVAHAVHILSEFRARFVELGDRREALVQTLYLVGTPCMMTAITTAIGFGAMSFVPIKSIAHMGVYSFFGVMFCFVLSLTLLLSFLSFGRRAPRPGEPRAQEVHAKGGRVMRAVLSGTATFVIRWRRPILAGFGSAADLLAGGHRAAQGRLQLAERLPRRTSAQAVDHLRGRGHGRGDEPRAALRRGGS